MGMFDTVLVPCSECGNTVEFQSKAGDCSLSTFSLTDVPVVIARDLHGVVKRCNDCSSLVRIIISPKPPEVVEMIVSL